MIRKVTAAFLLQITVLENLNLTLKSPGKKSAYEKVGESCIDFWFFCLCKKCC